MGRLLIAYESKHLKATESVKTKDIESAKRILAKRKRVLAAEFTDKVKGIKEQLI